jgi:hypothetical protein
MEASPPHTSPAGVSAQIVSRSGRLNTVKNHFTSGGRYPVLRTIAILWLISGFVAFFVGVFYQAGAILLAHAIWRIGDIALSGAVAAMIWPV